ncbi:AzlC family ABC transporter permease [Sphaerochaeta sp. PS]|uniref:AzlC family ABC transporter permease n=1 Tax=Sphaerochaeta sp. PS TaxID=3076336 RepID=UPI0028A3F9A8|nr:AzlC family ABC transporter permease [Sphaerochaeta sp. PS]MDT4762029.1 AzlC family ABC transporter permease [Sphaerochaeta sp. PS]
MISNAQSKSLTFSKGVQEGFPICVGYFPTAMAFGLVCRDVGLKLWESVLFSVTNFAGSGQFLAINLLASGSLILEICIGVLLINLRYLFMGAALNQKLEKGIHGPKRLILAHGTTDEVFSVAVLHKQELSWTYMMGLEGISYLGWVGGTAVGFLIGMILSPELQMAVGVTLYAMFISLFAQELRQKGVMVLLIAGFSAILNTALILVLHMGSGWSFVIAMLSASIFGALIIDEPETEALP